MDDEKIKSIFLEFSDGIVIPSYALEAGKEYVKTLRIVESDDRFNYLAAAFAYRAYILVQTTRENIAVNFDGKAVKNSEDDKIISRADRLFENIRGICIAENLIIDDSFGFRITGEN